MKYIYRKKICFILPCFFEDKNGGAEYQAYIIANELKKKNYEVHYIYTTDSQITHNNLDIFIHPLPIRKSLRKIFTGKDYFIDFFRIIKLLNRIDPDIVYQRVGCAYTGIAAFYCKKNQKHMIWHIAHDKMVSRYKFNFNKNIISDFIDYRFFMYGLRNAKTIIAQTNNQKELLMNNFNRKCDTIIPNFHPIPNNDPSKPISPISIVWIANWKKWKHPEIFIRLAKQLQYVKNIHFIMIGRIGNSKWKKNLLKEAKSIPKLEINGELPLHQVNQVLTVSHLIVNTSDSEGFSNTFIQAWMQGVPVVSMNADPSKLLSISGLGYLCPTFVELSQKVKFLIDNDEHRSSLATHCRKYAISNFSIEKNLPKILNIFEK